MLAFILENIDKKIYSEVHFDEKLGFHGFTIENNSVHKINQEVFEVLNMLKLSNNRVSCGFKDGYEVFCDARTGLYHFFKDNKEDIKKFWLENSVGATLMTTYHDRLDFSKSFLRKVKVLGYSLLISALICDAILVNEAINKAENTWTMEVPYNENTGIVSYAPILNTVKFTFEGEEERFNKKVTSDIIYELIYSSENLNKDQKDFLWNSELINDIMPYYDDLYSNVILQTRHYNISFNPFDDEDLVIHNDSNGYYNYDNILHLRNIPFVTEEANENGKETAAHEYAHLLQINNYLMFITEASAELIEHEYFLNSADSSLYYSYDKACKYTKILMEIIGPEAIWDYNFRNGTNSIQNAVKPYFDENEYNEFFSILELSPYWDEDKFEEGLYNRLEELLSILYNRKFNDDINNNDLITAIKLGVHHNRAYFRKSLIDNTPSFYINAEKISLNEAVKRYPGLIDFKRQIVVDRKDQDEILNRLSNEHSYFNSHFRVVSAEYEVLNVNMESVNNSQISGTVSLRNGEELIDMDIEEAYSKGYVNIETVFIIHITYKEFKENFKKGEYFVEMFHDDWKFNYDYMVFVGNSHNNIECETKMISLEEAYNQGIVKFSFTKFLNEEEYLNLVDNEQIVHIRLKFKDDVKVLGGSYSLSGKNFSGVLVIETSSGRREIEVNEVIKLGLAEKVFQLDREVSLEEFLTNKSVDGYRIHKVYKNDENVISDITSDFGVAVLEYKKNYIPSINEKFLDNNKGNSL